MPEFALQQEFAGAKLRPSREQSMTFARWGVSDIENYSSCSQKAGTYLSLRNVTLPAAMEEKHT